MKLQPSLVREAAHSLKFLMQRCTSDLAGQLLTSGILTHLLEILGSNLPGRFIVIVFNTCLGVENPAAAKAEIVDALKFACRDLQHGQKITDELNKSPTWAQYRDQRHDLFLPAARTQAIAGSLHLSALQTLGPTGSSAVAGYLTESMFEPPKSAPPPQSK